MAAVGAAGGGGRPKRARNPPNYLRPEVKKRISRPPKDKQVQTPSDKLYRVQVIEEDKDKGLVKVRYLGYDSSHDEWRKRDDIVQLDESDDCSEEEYSAEIESSIVHPFSLYDELATKIKTLLNSGRKGDPVCSITMSFDPIYFEGLARRGSALPSGSGRRQYHTVKVLTHLDDVLGRRWYVRGLNVVGDFSYVIPGSVKYHLKYCKPKTEYQMQTSGVLSECSYGGGYQLMFQFVRGDGTPSQWNNVLKSSQSVFTIPQSNKP